MKLPFLQKDNWPTAREPDEKVVNPSYDTQIEDHLMDELLVALEKRDSSKLRENLVALIQHLQSQENSDEM
jgi:hypothetical protein